MKKITLLLTVLLLLLHAGHAVAGNTATTLVKVSETMTSTLSSIIGKGLPVVYVTTVDNEEPVCEIVYAPAGSWGSTINSEKVPGRMLIYNRVGGVDSVLYDSGDYEKDVSGMTIKVRGNTSAKGERKPYKLKLQKKSDLLMRGVDSVYKDKEWLLLKDDNLYNMTGFNVSRLVGMKWVPGRRFVNVVLNNEYRGIYLLTESVKRNPKCRLDVDKDWGFIFENDVYWWNEPVYVISPAYHPSYNYTFKYPDEDEITEDQLAYMRGLVSRFESSQVDGSYPDVIDVKSFASWCLVHDLMGIKDGGGCNRYYTKYDTTAASKIFMPVAWDFDMAERTSSAWSRCHTVYMARLFASSNRAYVNEYVRQWCLLRDSFLEDVNQFYEEFVNSDEGRGLSSSYYFCNVVWNQNLWSDYLLQWRHDWLVARYEWLDANIMALHVPNDVNVDGVVNIGDVTSLIGMLLGNTRQMVTGDITGDGDINISDVTALINQLLK